MTVSSDSPLVEQKLARLRARMRALGSVLVCYSGGIDSALVLAIAHQELGARAVAMTALSPSLPERERREAASVAKSIGADHRFVNSQEIADVHYAANNPDRCFYCKSELYRIAEAKRKQWGLAVVVNGTNSDDLGDYRPGLRAASDAAVVSPLVELGFNKQDVRAGAQLVGLTIWNKPAAACLASRIPYGTSVTRQRLAQVGGFEAFLKERGYGQLRVRYHGELARIELAMGELARAAQADERAAIVAAGKQHGFKYVTLDLGGYRQGSHNEVLVGRSLRVLP